MNNWLDKLERKFSRYAIPNLITYIIILYAAGFALELINPTFYSQFLSLKSGCQQDSPGADMENCYIYYPASV